MINVKGNTYYIPGHVCIGVYVQGSQCVLIDTGLDENAARKVLKELKQMDITPAVIINTHAHADHFGGNAFIQKRQNVIVCTSEKESVTAQYPIYEPFYLFSAAPLNEMKNKFFMASPSKVDEVIKTGKIQVGGFDLEVISLPGHSIDQIGIVTPDNILFCGDTLIGKHIIDKYSLPYIYDVEQQYNTLNYLKGTSYDGYVLAHGGLAEDISSEVEMNFQVMQEIEKYLLGCLQQPATREELLAMFVRDKGIHLTMIQYPLLSASLSAYLSYLANHNYIKYYFEQGKLYWQACQSI
ncbi:MBL fold metallo-hydrolase [Petroclostridium sp. X23]|uniref:MBL fold metallo-hydrolase n=1 Tax=Petroclostridium sp. X23 TaxID=3045146 RepID=UPI0024AC85B4|nr:MBL fold metallo-hydrolase [Petroclostridium sp. X23]WHH60736.1 MBL fold metallo-hydrolase [Petroclostridium sp. X23]